jgi:uncharacterized protein YihD (DUF1040 family)
MAKELPYFQFEPAEYLTKDVSFCTLSAQGLFINICSFYWQRKCDLTKDQFLRRFNYESEFNELIKEGVIDLEDDKIIIKFLDNQFDNATKTSRKNSENGSKGGRPKKTIENPIENPIKSENKPKINPNKSELKGIKEDNIKENKIIKDKVNDINERKLKFSSTLSPYLSIYGKDMLNDFYKYWTEPNQSNTKFKKELEKTWSLERRLETWAKNDKNFKNNGKQFTKQNANEALENRLKSYAQSFGVNQEPTVSETISERTSFDDYEEIP